MYLAIVLLTMFVLPVGSIVVEMVRSTGGGFWPLVGKWFVFWGVGVRLGIAGLNQIFRADFTAQTIFGLTEKAASKIVVELGFANVAFGVIGLISLLRPAWVLPAAVAAGIFYGLDALQHIINGERNASENIATISDAWIFVVLAAFVVATAFSSKA
jgi:hypothetical protein